MSDDGWFRVETSGSGITVTGSMLEAGQGGQGEAGRPLTRYALALRRQAANRQRRKRGEALLAELRAGSCDACGGWGVVGALREVCGRCGGSGDR